MKDAQCTSARRQSARWWRDMGFNTRKGIESEIRATMNSYEDKKRLSPKHSDFMTKVFQHHAEFQEKTGPGLAWFMIDRHPHYKTRCFHIVRTDGTVEMISWLAALPPEGGTTLMKDVLRAARNVVRNDMQGWVRKTAMCTLCAEPITSEYETHVDHIVPFPQVWDTYVHETQSGNRYPPLVTSEGRVHFADDSLAKHWRQWHNQHAQLRRVHKVCNLSRPRKL